MKKLFEKFKMFFSKHYKLGIAIAIVILLISSTAVIYSNGHPLDITTVCFMTALPALLRFITYRTGHIPIVVMDKTWDRYRFKYRKECSEDEIEDKYKEMSLRNASVFLMISIASFIIWLIVELVLWIF